MKNFLSSLTQWILYASLFVNAALLYQVYTLPSKLNGDKTGDRDRDTITIIRTASLDTKNDFIFFSGQVTSKPKVLKDFFSYDPSMPEEVWEGFIYESKSNKGGSYYIWSTFGDYPINKNFSGWFMQLSGQSFQFKNGEYVPMLFPIVRKD